MPTGYTDELDRKNLDTKTWIMKSLARAYCICITMRDDGDLTEKQILKRLTKDSEDSEYHTECLNKARKNLKKYQSMTNEQWKRKMEYENQQNKKTNEKYKREADQIKKIHDRTKKDLERILQTKGLSTITTNILKFGIDQLKLTESECEPYKYNLCSNEYIYKQEKISEAKHDIQYHKKELEAEKKRGKDRLKMYLQLKKDIDRILK